MVRASIAGPAMILVCAIGGYLLGSIPFGLLLTRAAGLGDIRSIGSGNIGATNVLRTGNRKLAAATLLLDGLKASAAVLLARGFYSTDAGLVAGLAAVIGHLFPVWLGFRGGKGVATGFGVLFAAVWPAGLIAACVWMLIAWQARISSLGALSAFVAAPPAAWLFGGGRAGAAMLAIAVLIFLRHDANIRRLLAGTEPRMGRSS
jgi:glycerol-3-phosphate acyltransferase PlsY